VLNTDQLYATQLSATFRENHVIDIYIFCYDEYFTRTVGLIKILKIMIASDMSVTV